MPPRLPLGLLSIPSGPMLPRRLLLSSSLIAPREPRECRSVSFMPTLPRGDRFVCSCGTIEPRGLLLPSGHIEPRGERLGSGTIEPLGDRVGSGAIEPRGLWFRHSETIEPRGLLSTTSMGVMLPLGVLCMSGQMEPRGLRSKSKFAMLPRGLLVESGISECLGLREVPKRALPFSGIREVLEAPIATILFRGLRLYATSGTKEFLGLRAESGTKE